MSSETAVRYVCRDGDVLDWICWHHYGQQAGAVELVLRANPGLSAMGAVLPAGHVINLPALPKPATTVRPVRLWD